MASLRIGPVLAVCIAFGAAFVGVAPRASSRTTELGDLLFETQVNSDARMAGCNSASVLSIHGGPPLYQLPRPEDVDLVDGFATTADFRDVFILASWGNPSGPKYAPRLVRLRSDTGNWNDWTLAPPITGARFSYDRSFTILPDDETLLVEEWGPLPKFDYGSFIGKYCLSDVRPDGSLGPRRGTFSDGEGTPRQLIASGDGRHAYVVSEAARFAVVLDAVTMQPDGLPIPMISDGGDEAPYNEFIGSISPDEHYLVTRRRVEDALGVVDLVAHTAWLLPTVGLCPYDHCGEVAFNHAPLNHGLLAVHGGDQLVIFEFVPHGPLRQLGRLPLNWNPSMTFRHMPLAWSGDGQFVVVGTERPNGDELLVVRVDDGGRRLTEYRVLTGCPGSLGQNSAHVLFTANRRLARVTPAVPCAPPTPSPTATSTTTLTAVRPSPTDTPSSTPTLTASPTRTPTSMPTATPTGPQTPLPTATPAPVPVYLPLALSETPCVPGSQRIDVALVIDASTSMRDNRTSAGRTKLDAATNAARVFVATMSLPLDQAAVITFNSDAQVVQGLTGNRTDVDAALGQVPQLVRQQTRIDRGIEVAHGELTSPRHVSTHRAVLILLTDGLANPEPASTAVRRAQAAKDDSITLFTIGLGMEDELNIDELTQMASRPDYFFLAPDAEDLAGIYRSIAVEIPCPKDQYWGGR